MVWNVTLNCEIRHIFYMWKIVYRMLLAAAVSFILPPLKIINTVLIAITILLHFVISSCTPSYSTAEAQLGDYVHVNMNVVKLFSH